MEGWTGGQRVRMLGSMRNITAARPTRFRRQIPGSSLVLCGALALASSAGAQSCTTQAQMSPAQRTEIGEAAYRLASGVLAGNANAVQKDTIAPFASNFGATASLVQSTSAAISGDSVAVTQLYLLDASARAATDTSDAGFSCPLAGTAAETDFSIPGLPPGRYAFAMVEATGPHPWLLSFLLQAEGGGWKMAGFYPHRRTVAGHNGVWYWSTARADAKGDKPWLSYVLYGEADQLLRPAGFVSSTNLDRLRSEMHAAAPPALAAGLSQATPLVLPGVNGAEFRFTSLGSEAAENGDGLNLVVHLQGEPGKDAAAETATNVAAATALLEAHPELRAHFDNLWVITDIAGANPFVTERPMAEIGAGK